MSEDREADFMSDRWILRLHTKWSHWNRSLIFLTPTMPKCARPKCTSHQSVPRQNVPRQSVLCQSATHAKVPLTPKCPFLLICQSGIHANVALCQSCTHAKVVIRQNVRVKVFHAKVFYAKMSVSLVLHMHKKFEVNWTNIKGGCQSYTKVAPRES